MSMLPVVPMKTKVRTLRNRIKNPTCPFAPDADILIEIINSRGFEPDDMNTRIFDVLNCAMIRTRQNMIDDETAKKYLSLLQAATSAVERGYFTKKQAATLDKWMQSISDRCNKIINNEPIVNQEEVEEEAEQFGPEGPRRLRFAETVLRRRTNQIALVLERCFNNLNQQAVIRTAECLGIQYIYVVKAADSKRKNLTKKLTIGNHLWLTIKSYETTTACIEALRNEGRQIWATDLSADSISLEATNFVVPDKVAIVMGNESDGVSAEMLEAAEKRIYLPMHGFSESLNLSVASALVLQKLFYLCPNARGNLTNEEMQEIREDWYLKLSNNDKQEALYKSFLPTPPAPLEDLRRCNNFKKNMSWVDKSVLKRKREAQIEEQTENTKRPCITPEA